MTHSAGFRHGSIAISATVLAREAAATGRLQIIHSEDVSRLSADGLRDFDALLFFTSGELPITEEQKRGVLEWVRGGKGFAGVHSATDTFYQWPEYEQLIGARFNGHPWTQTVRIDIEHPDHPSTRAVQPGFSILDEIYQFREFSRARSRVLMTLDTRSVNLAAEGTNPGMEDFPLAWAHPFGQGRVYYNALGHFDETWLDPRFQRMMIEALLWVTGQSEGDATPRNAAPELFANGIANAASFEPRMTVAPGSAISIFGRNLTTGASMLPAPGAAALKLAGATVKLNGAAIPLLFASPGQINAYVPFGGGGSQQLEVATGAARAVATVGVTEVTPGIFAVTVHDGVAVAWATGLGPVERQGAFDVMRLAPAVRVGGVAARVFYSGLAPGWLGLYQVNVELPAGVALPATLELEVDGKTARASVSR